MIKTFENQKGQTVVISDMSDRYLKNAIGYFEKRLNICNEGNECLPKTKCGGYYAIDTTKLTKLLIALKSEKSIRGEN